MLTRSLARSAVAHGLATVLCLGTVLVAGPSSAGDANPTPCNFLCRFWLGSDDAPTGSSAPPAQAPPSDPVQPQQAPQPSYDTYAVPPIPDESDAGAVQPAPGSVPRRRKVVETNRKKPARVSKSQPRVPAIAGSPAGTAVAAPRPRVPPPAAAADRRPVPSAKPDAAAATAPAPAPDARPGVASAVANPYAALPAFPQPAVSIASPWSPPSPQGNAPAAPAETAASVVGAPTPLPPVPAPDAVDDTKATDRPRILPPIDTADVTASIPRAPDPARLHDHAPVLVAMIKVALPRQSSIASDDFHPTSADVPLVAAEIGLETEMLRTSETDAAYGSCIAAHLDALVVPGPDADASEALAPNALARRVAEVCGAPQPARRVAEKSNFLYLSLRRYKQILLQMHADGEPILKRVIATQLALRKASDHHVFACLEQGYLGGSDGGLGQPLVFRLLMSSVDTHGEQNDAVAGLIVSSMDSYCADEEFSLSGRKS